MSEASVTRRGVRLITELVKLSPLPFVVSVTGAAVFAFGTVMSAVVLGRITDRVVLPTFETGEIPDGGLRWAIIGVVAVTIIRAAGVVCRRYFAALTAERAQIKLRHRLLDQYLTLPMSWHQRVPAGQLLAHTDNDTEVTTEVIHPLPFSLGVAVLAVFSAIALVAVDPIIAVVALLIFPALTMINRVYSSRIERPAAEVQASVGRVSSIAHESFDGALVVKTLGRSEAESERFGNAVEKLRSRRVDVGYIRAAFEAIMDSLPSLGIVAVIVVGAYRIQAGAMTHGDLIQVAAIFAVLAMPMRVFGFFLEMLPPSVVARERLGKVFDEPHPADAGAETAPGDGPLGLEARGLRFSYDGNHQILAGVDLAIAPGEVVALVGSTGSGKSTLTTVLAGLIPPSGGQVFVTDANASDGARNAVDIDRIDNEHRTDAVVTVFQESFLFADTLRANVDLAGSAGDGEIRTALATAKVDGLIEELPAGLDTILGERGVTLSGGQRQRVALARALLRRPRFLILDDATSAVDAVIERQILDGLRTELETTTLIVAQRVSTIELADRVLYLDGGRIEAAGTHHQLLTNEGYRALVSAYEQVVQ
ncbi:MAG: ABC transporter ATP-binding protein [Actinomycetia bacterium]|nr:ABC transporter ATP-binding protein [Actinomycetes bacterium]